MRKTIIKKAIWYANWKQRLSSPITCAKKLRNQNKRRALAGTCTFQIKIFPPLVLKQQFICANKRLSMSLGFNLYGAQFLFFWTTPIDLKCFKMVINCLTFICVKECLQLNTFSKSMCKSHGSGVTYSNESDAYRAEIFIWKKGLQ